MSFFANLNTLDFIRSGEVTIEDYDTAWIRLNVEKASQELIDHYLDTILQFLRKSVKTRISILKSATSVIVNLPVSF